MSVNSKKVQRQEKIERALKNNLKKRKIFLEKIKKKINNSK
jgi:hypothetical protein